MPYVIKVDDLAEINHEATALESARAYFTHAANVRRIEPEPANGLAALVYPLIATENDVIIELRELYELRDPDQVQVYHDELIRIFNLTYDTCRYAHNPAPSAVELVDEYQQYMRASRPDRIVEAFGANVTNIDLLGHEYRHPLTSLQALQGQRVRAPVGFVHGDLHPNNVVIGEGRTPALIDFAWAHHGDIMKDFVLMECSVRLLLFPPNIRWSDHHWVATQMVSQDGPAAVRDRFEGDSTQPHAERYVRMARVVETIRNRAISAMDRAFDFQHYLAAQFLVLYGLSKLGVYSFYPVVDVLGLIGDELLP